MFVKWQNAARTYQIHTQAVEMAVRQINITFFYYNAL